MEKLAIHKTDIFSSLTALFLNITYSIVPFHLALRILILIRNIEPKI